MKSRLASYLLPMLGFGALLALWAFSSATWSKNLPSPAKTWEVSKDYVLEPLAKRGELDQGSCALPGTPWCWWPRATPWRC